MADIYFTRTKVSSGVYWKLAKVANVSPQERSRLSLELREYQACAGDIGEPEMAERAMAKIRSDLKQIGHNVHLQENKSAEVVNVLLETDEFVDPKGLLMRDDFDGSANKAVMHVPMYGVDGAARRTGDGYEDQWEIPYKDWLFVVSFYEDGTQIWSAHYKTKPSTPRQHARGYGLSGGGDPQKLTAGSDPEIYLARLKKMADQFPSEKIYRTRSIPHMPHPDGPDSWRADY